MLPAGASAEALPEGLRPVETLVASAGHRRGLVRRAAAVPGGKPRRGAGADHGGRPLRRGGADGDGVGSASPVSHIEGPLRRGGAVPPSAAGIRRVYRAEPGDGAGAGVCPHSLRPHGSAGRRLLPLYDESLPLPPGSCCRRRWRQGCRRALTGASFCRSCGGPALAAGAGVRAAGRNGKQRGCSRNQSLLPLTIRKIPITI